MGRVVSIMIVLFILVVGFLVVSTSTNLFTTDKTSDMDIIEASMISNKYVYMTIEDIKYNIKNDINSKLQFYFINKDNLLIDVKVNIDSLIYYKISSYVKYNSSVCSTYVVYKRLPYSEYSLFVNNFPDSYYGNKLRFDGLVYVNGYLGVGDLPGPIFNDKVFVTKTVKYYNKASKSNFKGFKQGVVLNYETIKLPTDRTKLGLLLLKNKSFSIDMVDKIVLNYSYVKMYSRGLLLYNIKVDSLKKYNSILYKDIQSTTYVLGILDGRLTIASQGKIVITNNILYNDFSFKNMNVSTSSKNILSLMTSKNIELGDLVSNNTFYNTYNVYICANLFSVGKIEVYLTKFPWKVHGLNNDNVRKLYVYGSRTQGYMDTQTYSNLYRYGLALNTIYDSRLQYLTPPGAPYTENGGIIILWKLFKREVTDD